jgi:hypothetical protein
MKEAGPASTSKIRSVKKTTKEHEKNDSNERGRASQHFENQECKK